MLDLRPVNAVIGVLVALLGAMMLLPAIVDLLSGSQDWSVFGLSSAAAVFVGIALWMSGHTRETPSINLRQAFLITTVSWILLAGFGALPFVFGKSQLDFAAAYFEAMSGLTTTGSTAITGLDTMSPGILMWRALLQFYGGAGVIVVAIAVLPMLRIGGMQLFRAESSDRSPEKIFPAAAQIAGSILAVYIILNIACAFAFAAAGMSGFDAILHAFTTVSTGGLATHDASLGFYKSAAVDWVAIVFMVAGSLPFVLYVQALRGRPQRLTDNPEVRFFVWASLVAALLLWAYVEVHQIETGPTAFRHALFTVVSMISSTGFATTDYTHWGPFPDALIFVVTLLGGCTGSTSGGLKPFRIIIASKMILQQFKRMIFPNGIFPLTYEHRRLGDDVALAVFGFLVLFFAAFGLLTAGVAAAGMEFKSAISAVAAMMANAGPGLGPVVGPAGHYGEVSPIAHILLSFGMLIGRLELFTVLVLLLPRFWRP